MEAKINSQTYCQFFKDVFFKQSASFKKIDASKCSTAWLASKGLQGEKKLFIH